MLSLEKLSLDEREQLMFYNKKRREIRELIEEYQEKIKRLQEVDKQYERHTMEMLNSI